MEIVADITENIETFQDVLDIYLKTNKLTDFQKMLLDYSGDDNSAIIAQANEQLAIIAKTLNQGHEPELINKGQCKWYPSFHVFSDFFCNGACYTTRYSSSHDGLRLFFNSKELALFAGNKFKEIYKKAYIGN